MPQKRRKTTKKARKRNPSAVSEAEKPLESSRVVLNNDDRFNFSPNRNGHYLWTVVDLPDGQVYWYKY